MRNLSLALQCGLLLFLTPVGFAQSTERAGAGAQGRVIGHAPGPTVGMWDLPDAVEHTGDWPLYPNTGFSIEGNIAVPLSMWDGQHVQIKLEQSSCFDGDRILYLAGRQTEWHVIR